MKLTRPKLPVKDSLLPLYSALLNGVYCDNPNSKTEETHHSDSSVPLNRFQAQKHSKGRQNAQHEFKAAMYLSLQCQ